MPLFQGGEEQGYFSFSALLTILFLNVMYVYTSFFTYCRRPGGLYAHTKKWDMLKW